MSTEYEYMVRSYYARLDRTIETGPTDEETARFILADVAEGFTGQLLRRRKASPWALLEGDNR